jgi:hypothetical protein
MDATEDLTASRDLIKQGTPEQWSSFEETVKMIQMEDLAKIAERLGCAEQTSWQDYCDAFGDYEWYQFCEAYQHCLFQPFTLPTN